MIICITRKLINITNLVSLYYEFIYKYLMYCIELLCEAVPYYKGDWNTIQKNIVRSDFTLSKVYILVILHLLSSNDYVKYIFGNILVYKIPALGLYIHYFNPCMH